jgi:rare lipoprotein A
MKHPSAIVILVAVISLAGCASQSTPPSSLSVPPQAPPPQASVGQPFFTETGVASFYGAEHDGNTTANGETFNPRSFTAAHNTLAFGTVVRVTNTGNGRSVKVSINDRGPHIKGRIIDLSAAAARALGIQKDGVVSVRLEAFQQDQAPD